MFNALLNELSSKFNLDKCSIYEYSPLVLAYIGDAVYETYIRTLLVCQGNIPVNMLHKKSIAFVKAKSQCEILHKIMDSLNDEELDMVRRGRNTKSNTMPKNASITDYKYATGFETLIGFLYLKNDIPRLMKILELAIE